MLHMQRATCQSYLYNLSATRIFWQVQLKLLCDIRRDEATTKQMPVRELLCAKLGSSQTEQDIWSEAFVVDILLIISIELDSDDCYSPLH